MQKRPEHPTPSTAHVREVYAMQHGDILADEHRREFDRWLDTLTGNTDQAMADASDDGGTGELRLTVTIDVDHKTTRTIGDLANALRATANRLELDHGSGTCPRADIAGLAIAPAGTPVGLWSVGPRSDSIPQLTAKLTAARAVAANRGDCACGTDSAEGERLVAVEAIDTVHRGDSQRPCPLPTTSTS